MDSRKWLARQKKDIYTKQAKQQGYLSRASFKLLQIQERDHFIKPGMVVMDLGAAPGGWSQVLAEIMMPPQKLQAVNKCTSISGVPSAKNSGKIIALDRLPLHLTLPEVHFIQGDFTQQECLDTLLKYMQHVAIDQFDLVLSDMAPNTSGVKMVDQYQSIHLAEQALDFCIDHLKTGGDFLVKVFEGQEFAAYRNSLQEHFAKVMIRKPRASRSASRELYLLACSKHALN